MVHAAPTNSGACDTRPPADVMIVFDHSGSMSNGIEALGVPPPGKKTRMAAAQIGVGSLLSSFAAIDRAGLVSYSTQVSFDSPLTFDKAAVAAKVFALVKDDDTFAEPAIRAATQELLANGRPGVRKVIVHLSDGFSFGNPVAAASDAKAAGIEFYAVAIGNDPRPLQATGRDILRQQASDAAHFAFVITEQAVYDFFDLIGDQVRTRQLSARSESFNIKGTGLLGIVNSRTLVNAQTYVYDDNRDPALVSPGGTSQVATVGLNAPLLGLALDSGTIRNSATGSQGTGAARVDALARIENLNLSLAGIGTTATVVQTKARATFDGSTYSSSAGLVTADAKVGNATVAVNVARNSVIAIPGLLSITLNAQPPEVKTANSVRRSVAFAVISSPLLGSLTLAQSSVQLSCQ